MTWACSSGINDPIDVHVYLGGAAGGNGAVMVGGYRAGSVSEPGVANACGASGSNYRFYIPIQGDWTVTHANKPIYIHGISPVGAVNLTIGGSGNFRIPYNTPPSVAFTSPAAGVGMAACSARRTSGPPQCDRRMVRFMGPPERGVGNSGSVPQSARGAGEHSVRQSLFTIGGRLILMGDPDGAIPR